MLLTHVISVSTECHTFNCLLSLFSMNKLKSMKGCFRNYILCLISTVHALSFIRFESQKWNWFLPNSQTSVWDSIEWFTWNGRCAPHYDVTRIIIFCWKHNISLFILCKLIHLIIYPYAMNIYIFQLYFISGV